jgi:hypothetical protein
MSYNRAFIAFSLELKDKRKCFSKSIEERGWGVEKLY